MNAIKQFNIILNKSPLNRFEYWEKYRSMLTEYILSNITYQPHSALILGCGNSDDLDLLAFKEAFKNITISDIDEDALKRAVSKYNIPLENIDLVPIDYSGLNESTLWNNFVNEMLKIDTTQGISSFFNKLKNIVDAYSFTTFNNKYDLIIISPIYTQLLVQQGLSYISILNNLNYPQNLLIIIQENLLNLASILINRFNQNVVNLLKKNSELIVISDIFETKLDSQVYSKIKSLKNIDQYHLEYIDQYGLGLGDFGLYNLEEILTKETHKWFEWPFDPEKSIFVKVSILKN